MRVGLVCPYSFDVPGGVQYHVRDLAEWLIAAGHDVSVLAPADDEVDLPPYLVSCGRALPVRYNGSVARLTFGPVTQARANRWLDEGNFDVVHLHEPVTPSVSVMTLWAATEPVVATFHTANLRSRAMHAAQPLLRPSLEKIRGRIAVSEEARRTVRRHLRGDAVVIPNGVDVGKFGEPGRVAEQWRGTSEAPTVGFLGRIDEPRKGLAVLLEALPVLVEAVPGIRLLIAGPGDAEAVRGQLPEPLQRHTEFLGGISDRDKVAFLQSVDLYVAPQTGGESFGIVLVEAMAAGAPVVASDLPAFRPVLDDGRCGELFPVADGRALAHTILALLRDPARRRALRDAGRERARLYDWDEVASRIVSVYEMVIDGAEHTPSEPAPTSLWGRLVRAPRGGDA